MTDTKRIINLIDDLIPVLDQLEKACRRFGDSSVIIQGKLLELKNQACAQTCKKDVN